MSVTLERHHHLGPATLYTPHPSLGLMCKIEIIAVRYFRHRFAHCPNAVYVDYRLPHEPLFYRVIQLENFSIVILDGWNHIDPVSPFIGRDPSPATLPTLEMPRRRFDSKALTEFSALIDIYIARHAPRVIADFRQHVSVPLSA